MLRISLCHVNHLICVFFNVWYFCHPQTLYRPNRVPSSEFFVRVLICLIVFWPPNVWQFSLLFLFFIRVPQSNWCLNVGEPLGPVQFILWPDVSYQVFIPIMSCFVTEIDQNCTKDVIDYDCNRKWTISSHSCTEFCKPSDVHWKFCTSDIKL